MRFSRICAPAVVLAIALAGCHSHPLTDFRPLDQAGVWSSDITALRKMNVSDAEVAQLVKAKHAGLSDDALVALVKAARAHGQPFVSAAPAANMLAANFSEPEILALARAGELDAVSGDAVTLRLIGLSDAADQTILQRRLAGQPTLSNEEIARLKNTGLTERQILSRIDSGMTDAQAEAEVVARNRASNRTGFVRVGRRRR
jgi:hypothetical protein